MYGLEKDQKTGVFDLERDLSGADKVKKAAEIKKMIAARQDELKKSLREGEDKETFAVAEALLNGYNSLSQVVERITR